MFRRKGAPDWAPFTDAGDWRQFERLVRADIAPRGWTGDVRAGELTDGHGRFFLFNLAQICHGEPRAEWPVIVADHFDVCAVSDDVTVLENRGEARVALRARLVDEHFLSLVDWEAVTRRVADDLLLVLVFDLPDRVVITRREEVIRWGEEDELFTLALEQTRAERDLELEQLELENSEEPAPLFVLSGDSFYTATHALWADEFDPPESDHGTLVAVPNRHCVLAHPIRDGSVLGVIEQMQRLTQELESEGPGAISTNLYWLHDGAFETLPSADFTDLLNRLV